MYLFMAEYKGETVGRFYRKTEAEVWDAIAELEAYGLEREYTPSKRELKKEGWSVGKYLLQRVGGCDVSGKRGVLQ